MLRNCSLDEISDGRLYEANDMVKAYCNECKGCHACCEGMCESIILDPLDIYRLTKETGKSFEALLADTIELNVVDGLILPNIKMVDGKCSFLNEAGRCSIHAARPGFCRLFPLGRYYEDGGFKYFLQIHECERAGKVKVKVSKWIDTPDLQKNTEYINRWHDFLKQVQEYMCKLPAANDEAKADDQTRQICMLILNLMYIARYEDQKDFYEQFEGRIVNLEKLIEHLG